MSSRWMLNQYRAHGQRGVMAITKRRNLARERREEKDQL
jgi:hypothetical protein